MDYQRSRSDLDNVLILVLDPVATGDQRQGQPDMLVQGEGGNVDDCRIVLL